MFDEMFLGFFSLKVQTTQPAASDSALPGISQMKTQVPVKVTTMHLGASPLWNGGVLYDDSAQDAIQRGRGKTSLHCISTTIK